MTKKQSSDLSFMQKAVLLAKKARPNPNPQVGAVIVKNNKVVGMGYHKKPGLDHAEIIALAEAGIKAKGADLYVTLEPCCHTGNTGPCVNAIKEAGIKRVFIGIYDPDKRVSGGGLKALKQMNIETVVGVEKKICEKLLQSYCIHRTLGRPMVTLKAAVTLDGYIATHSGDSKWITCFESRKTAHELRARSDAVLAGINTVLADDPLLTVRHVKGKNPVRVVLDSRLKTPASCNLVKTRKDAPLIIACTDKGKANLHKFKKLKNVEILFCKSDKNDLVDIGDILVKLASRNIFSLLVEGGGLVHGAFVKAAKADNFALFTTPKILGTGIPWINFPNRESINDAVKIKDMQMSSSGTDFLIKGDFGDFDLASFSPEGT